MATPKTWGIKFSAPRAILTFLVATLLSVVVVAVSALFGIGSVSSVMEGMLELLQFLALLLSLFVAVFCPPQFPASRSLVSVPEQRTLRTGVASVGELLAVTFGFVGLLGLFLFTEGIYATQPARFFGVESTVLFNGPSSLGLLCVGVAVYICSVLIN